METKHIFGNIMIFLIIALFVDFIILCVFSVINEKKFKIICSLYIEKYDNLPAITRILKDAHWLTIPVWNYMKQDFFLSPLYSNKKSSHSNNENDIIFVKNLPPELTKTFLIERVFRRAGIILFLLLCLTLVVGKYIYHL